MEKCRPTLPAGVSDGEIQHLREAVLLFAEFIIEESLKRRFRVIGRRWVCVESLEDVDRVRQSSDHLHSGRTPVMGSRWVRPTWFVLDGA